MLRRMKTSEIPKRARKSESLFEVTPEWRQLRDAIDAGIKKGESLWLELPPKFFERAGLSGQPMAGRQVASGCYAVQRFLKKYLRAAGLNYTVRVQHSGHFDIIRVDGPKLPLSVTHKRATMHVGR